MAYSHVLQHSSFANFSHNLKPHPPPSHAGRETWQVLKLPFVTETPL